MMTVDEDRPSIAELYGVAATAGGAPNIILAAGLQRCRFGILLLRLKAEYDSVRQSLERSGQIRRRGVDAGRELRRQAAVIMLRAERCHGEEAEGLRHAAAGLLEEASFIEESRTPHEIKSARAFILLELKTLSEAKRQLGAIALRMAAKRGVANDASLRLAGRVLDVYLDELCHSCDGTGLMSSGYRGQRSMRCNDCRGSAHRRDILGNNQSETSFAADVFAELQRQEAEARKRTRNALVGDSEYLASTHIDPELRQWLGELRSVEAERD